MTVHVGILGGGNISGSHAQMIAEMPGLEVAAICGEDPEKTAGTAATYGAAAYRDVDRFLRHRPMDLVIVGTPSGLHAEHAIAAAEEGLHVLVEKPLDVSTARADAAIAAFVRSGTKLGVVFQERTAPELVWLKRLIQRGELGRLFLASARVRWYRDPVYYSESRWRGLWSLAGGGALMNQGVHTVDLLLWLLGDVDHVYARTRTALHSVEVEDTVVATLQFVNGGVATLEATTAAYPGYPRQIEISGTDGTVMIVGDNISRADLRQPPSEAKPQSMIDDSPRSSSPLISDTAGHRRVLEDFLLAVAADSTPLCDGAEGRRSVAVVEAIYRSAREGIPVRPA